MGLLPWQLRGWPEAPRRGFNRLRGWAFLFPIVNRPPLDNLCIALNERP